MPDPIQRLIKLQWEGRREKEKIDQLATLPAHGHPSIQKAIRLRSGLLKAQLRLPKSPCFEPPPLECFAGEIQIGFIIIEEGGQ